ncbi:hydrogenase maturation protease [Phytohabitans suffuscus]|uniref:Peptidase M52 n=1 Tax=Phytohabitans suffuscus TaxID=624315 RepID=A0A6F8YTQ9_9ACTN|nr:hydrogenase maturation protease [Phytohabitans suffuscus]BCB89565.1 peptidase M52 [Phytohabitans suffuscus]
MNHVVVGIGNEFRRDDGVGPAVVARLRGQDLPGVRIADCDGETGRLLELWRDADVVIVVDAVRVEHPWPGRIHRRSLRHPAVAGRPASSHGSDLGAAVELARTLGLLPRLLLLYAVEVADTSFGLGLSAPVAAAADRLAAEVAAVLRDRDPSRIDGTTRENV